MRMRAAVASLVVLLVACGGDAGPATTTAPLNSTSDPTTTTTPPPSTTAAPTTTTTTTTMIDGPVDVLALAPYPLQIAAFGPGGVGPVPESGLTMALLTAPLPQAAPPRPARGGAAPASLLGVFGAASGFDGDCLGLTLWAADFSSRFADGYVPISASGCGDIDGSIMSDDQVLVHTEHTLVVDLGTVPGAPFSPGFQLQNTAGDAGFYSVSQGLVVEAATVPAMVDGYVLVFGGDLLEAAGTGLQSIPRPLPPEGTCEPGEETLCLSRDRFRVEVDFGTADGGAATPGIPLTMDGSADDGGFWSLDEDRLDLFVKVFDGCEINDRFWVAAATLDAVEFEIRVTETTTGEVKSYPSSFDPIVDTLAFAACP